ncbi:hypothetical protein U1Q18_011340 [Sarracenia purpurea var. burkii]
MQGLAVDSVGAPSASMAGDGKLHIVVFPWLAFGHMIPFLELAKFIAEKGHKVTFVSTPRNIERLPIPNLTSNPSSSSPIDFVTLPLPVVHGLPENAEATMDVRSSDVHYLKKAFDGLEPDLTRFLKASAPDWIIYDFAPHWLPPIAEKLGISRAFFSIMNAWFAAFFGPASAKIDDDGESRPPLEPEQFTIPPKWVPFPTKIAYRLYEIKPMLSSPAKNASGVSDSHRVGLTVSGCEVFAVRHCREFEPDWLTLLEELNRKPVVPVGLIPPSLQEPGADEQTNETWVAIRERLSKQNSKSVVYVALGSEVTLSQEQLTELALGLELSGVPFFWALRKPPDSNEFGSDSVQLPNGFEERTRDRGILWMSWAPQLRILSHESVGGFLTHCGWSSIIEGLQFGQPLIMLPLALDQGLNARVIEDKKAGMEIPRDDRDGSFTRNSVAESIRCVMVGKEGRIFRNNAREMSALFGDKALHEQYMNKFVDYLQNYRSPKLSS